MNYKLQGTFNKTKLFVLTPMDILLSLYFTIFLYTNKLKIIIPELEIVCHKTKFKSQFKTQFTVLLHVAKILGQNTKHYCSEH